MLGNLRQLLFPREYRIRPRPGIPSLLGTSGDLAAVMAILQAQLKEVEKRASGSISGDLEASLAEIATNLWRIKGQMVKVGAEPSQDLRPLSRHLEAAIDALGAAGVQILDHTGEEIPEQGIVGIKKLAFEPTEGLVHEIVLETIKPTVLLHGQRIQMGEVIVGTPKREAGE
jgi:hypothetical protein